ncbi:pectate lyase [uncultured Alistipes sp.]|uniref:pectate lyase n=1 Tax=uncultured Alistipes sp. TaxID=538949 RepID=UPI0026701D59|nr:pectate lyase [uncultured Alistipes sp.]
MRKLLVAIAFAAVSAPAFAQQAEGFDQSVNRWLHSNRGENYPRFTPDQVCGIADNIIAYQNEDGGWPKNLDMMSRLDRDSVVAALKPRSRRSTLDNSTTHTQVEYLCEAYRTTGEERFRDAALRGMEYILGTQYPNGGWRGWDADAITFNDDVMYGVLSLWLEIIYAKPRFAWVDPAFRERICASWDRGLDLVLRCQWVRDGIRTVWAQQYDHETLQPVKARSYELPGLAAGESANIVMLLMRIRKPSPEVVEAVKAAAAWFDKNKITGKRIVTVAVPEGLPEDRSVKKDRRMVDDPDAAPIWARYYELGDDRFFLCTREGVKVYSLAEMPAERRSGYSWFGDWGNKVLKKYPSWLAKVEKQAARKK